MREGGVLFGVSGAQGGGGRHSTCPVRVTCVQRGRGTPSSRNTAGDTAPAPFQGHFIYLAAVRAAAVARCSLSGRARAARAVRHPPGSASHTCSVSYLYCLVHELPRHLLCHACLLVSKGDQARLDVVPGLAQPLTAVTLKAEVQAEQVPPEGVGGQKGVSGGVCLR